MDFINRVFFVAKSSMAISCSAVHTIFNECCLLSVVYWVRRMGMGRTMVRLYTLGSTHSGLVALEYGRWQAVIQRTESSRCLGCGTRSYRATFSPGVFPVSCGRRSYRASTSGSRFSGDRFRARVTASWFNPFRVSAAKRSNLTDRSLLANLCTSLCPSISCLVSRFGVRVLNPKSSVICEVISLKYDKLLSSYISQLCNTHFDMNIKTPNRISNMALLLVTDTVSSYLIGWKIITR